MGIIKVLLTAVLVFKLASSSCQTDPFIWTKIFKSNVGATVSDIAVDTENRYVFVGSFNTSLEVNQYSFQSRGSSDLFIAMTDSTGKVMWMKHWGGIYEDGQIFVETDQNNNIYVSGYFLTSTLVENQLIEVNGAGTFIVKMNSSGNLSWVKTLGPSCQLMEIKVNKDGAFGIAGFYGGAVDFGGIVSDNSNMLQNTIFFASYTTEGELNWVKFPESNSRYWNDLVNTVNLIDFDDHGNLYGVITFDNDLKINDKIYRGKKSALNLLFLKIDNTGSSSAGKVATMIDYTPTTDPFTSPGGIGFHGVGGDVDSEGNLSMAGQYFGQLDFSDFKLVQTDPASYPDNLVNDMFVLQFNKSFELVWAKVINNNSTHGKLKIGTNNQLIVSGVSGKGSVGGCPVNNGLFTMSLTKEGEIIRTTNLGRQWEGTYNHSTLDQNNNLLIAGLIGTFEDFDSKNSLHALEPSGFAGKYKLGNQTTSVAMTPKITSKKVCIYRDSITLAATPLMNFSEYSWELSSGDEKKIFYTSSASLMIPISFVPGTGDFSVRIKAFSPCQQSDFSETIFFRIPPHDFSEPLTIPNVITPNNDAKNDMFKLPAALSDAPVNVLNRWGNVVYSSNAYQNDWDGKDLATGVYFVTVKSNCLNEPIKSTLSIIR